MSVYIPLSVNELQLIDVYDSLFIISIMKKKSRIMHVDYDKLSKIRDRCVFRMLI